jgi:hypothetical protein
VVITTSIVSVQSAERTTSARDKAIAAPINDVTSRCLIE